MTTEKLLIWVLAAEGITLGSALLVVLAHAFWLKFDSNRILPLLDRGRKVLVAMMDDSSPSSAGLQILRAMPLRIQIKLFSDLFSQIGGGHRAQIKLLAEELGLVPKGEALCRSRWWWKRLYGARLLTIVGAGENVVPSLTTDPDPFVRAQAAEWAAEHPSEELIVSLLSLLSDPSAICRYIAKDALLHVGASAVDHLAEYLSNYSGNQVEAALEIAVWLAEPKLFKVTLNLCNDSSPKVRALSVSILGALGGEEGVNRVLELLEDQAPEVRVAAIQALGKLGYWPAAARIASLLGDEDWSVRREAGFALKVFGAPGILLLRSALSKDNDFAADMAQQVLSLPDMAR